MKKWIAAAGLACCVSAAVLGGCGKKEQPAETAAETTAEAAAEKKYSYENIGITLALPENFEDTKGAFYPHVVGEVEEGSGIRQLGFFYLAMPKEEYLEIVKTSQTRELTEEEVAHARSTAGTLAMIFSVDGGRDFTAVKEQFAKNGTEFDAKYAAEIGKAGDVTFYNYMEPNEDYTDGLEKEYAEEYQKLRGALEDAFTKAEYTAPEA